MRGLSTGRMLLLATAAVSLGWGQQPITITGLQSSVPGPFVPSIGAAITSGPVSSSLTNGFYLYINGNFDVGAPTVTWLDPSTGVPQTFIFTEAPSGILSFSGTQIIVLIPPTLFQTPVASPVSVAITVQVGTATSNAFIFTINPPLKVGGPVLPGGTINVPYSAAFATGGTGASAFVSAGTLPPGIIAPDGGVTFSGVPTAAGVFNFQTTVTDVWGYTASGNDTLTIVSPLPSIATTALPQGTAGSNYSATLSGRNGTPPYTWTATGLPPALSLNAATGVISGVLQTAGNYPVTVVLTDAAKLTAIAQYTLAVIPPPLSITTPIGLPPGVVGVAYTSSIAATSGTPPYAFSVAGGHLPDGLTLASGGTVSGTPIVGGLFSFSVTVTDSAGATASQTFFLTIRPALLNITGGPTSIPAGSPIHIAFLATGGVPPYSFTPGGNLPTGTTFVGGVLTGTPTSIGTFTFRVIVADSTGATFSKDFTVTVTPQPLNLGGSLSSGKAGVPYTGQITAAGGTGPYSYSGTGLPDGLSLSASGSITGTPGTAGQFILTATVTDSNGATASGTFPITIASGDLAIATASLPNSAVGDAYLAALAASGGVKPYTWTVTGLPDGVTATAAGAISGTPTAAGTFTVNVSVRDAAGTSVAKSYSVTIGPALALTTASAPNGTLGTAYAASFAASGGAKPYTFSANGLPAGLSMSGTGTISGSPAAAGPATIVVTVKDAAGASASRSFTITIGLPTPPPLSLSFAGVSDTAPPLQQPRLQVSLANTYPVDVQVTLTLTFAPDSGADDPTIQFSGGSRTTSITVPAGGTSGANDVGVQTGTVAGLITIAAHMRAAGQDVTPSPAPSRTIRVAAAAPVIVTGSLAAVRNSTGFTVTLTGFVTDREVTQAIFQFTGAAGSNLQTTTATVPVDVLFSQYFSGTGAAPFGSQFTYSQPFTVTGTPQAIASVTVTLVNKLGQSAPLTATLN